MSLPRTVAEILREHVTLEVESIDRMYLDVYVPPLQRELGVVSFLRYNRGHAFASLGAAGAHHQGLCASHRDLRRRPGRAARELRATRPP